MLDELNPAECLAKTNTTFLVGDTINTLTGCNKLASLHFGSDVSSETEAKLMMGYFSSSVEELLSNMKNVPDIFADGTATHQCVEPEIRFQCITTPNIQQFIPIRFSLCLEKLALSLSS